MLEINQFLAIYLVNKHSYWKWPFIVDLPIKNGGSFHSYVSLPEGIAYRSIQQTLGQFCFCLKSPLSRLKTRQNWVYALASHILPSDNHLESRSSWRRRREPKAPEMWPKLHVVEWSALFMTETKHALVSFTSPPNSIIIPSFRFHSTKFSALQVLHAALNSLKCKAPEPSASSTCRILDHHYT